MDSSYAKMAYTQVKNREIQVNYHPLINTFHNNTKRYYTRAI